MKAFMDADFLLETPAARALWREAAELPIIDYHCHIDPAEIAGNKQFKNLTEAWLYGDHYKWRAMRMNGIPEKYVTGPADDYERFEAWAATMPHLYGNPLYHWTHLELQRYFGVFEPLSPKSAPRVWEAANKALAREDMRVRGILEKSRVAVVCTTDDPADSLEHHAAIRAQGTCPAKVLPAFRPDVALGVEKPGFPEYIRKLATAANLKIDSFSGFVAALSERMDFFASMGCTLSDQGMAYVPFEATGYYEVERIFQKAAAGECVSRLEADRYRTYLLRYLAMEYSRRGWVMQLHLGPMRDNNRRMLEAVGPNTGYDSIGDSPSVEKLSRFCDSVEFDAGMPKTIFYVMNPADNMTVATLAGNFPGEVPGKTQFGAAWWFNDTRDGMVEQLKTVANTGLLSRFVGMLTDSRSFLSYTRHEYFRRILCNLVGSWAEKGEVPGDMERLSELVRDVCYCNAERYFGF